MTNSIAAQVSSTVRSIHRTLGQGREVFTKTDNDAVPASQLVQVLCHVHSWLRITVGAFKNTFHARAHRHSHSRTQWVVIMFLHTVM